MEENCGMEKSRVSDKAWAPEKNQNTKTQFDIVYENEEILIINKKAGISVQGGKDVAHPLDKELPLQTGYPVYLVHRLDKETSGLLIVAKSPLAAAKWTKLIERKLVTKEYTAICLGKLSKKEGIIRTNVVQHGNEKSAVTHYNVIEEKELEFEGQTYQISKVHLLLETGRMHQIRIHLSQQGNPILGDDKHGNFKINKIFKKAFKVKNLLLCASKLSFPVNGKNFILQIEEPDYFAF